MPTVLTFSVSKIRVNKLFKLNGIHGKKMSQCHCEKVLFYQQQVYNRARDLQIKLCDTLREKFDVDSFCHFSKHYKKSTEKWDQGALQAKLSNIDYEGFGEFKKVMVCLTQE